MADFLGQATSAVGASFGIETILAQTSQTFAIIPPYDVAARGREDPHVRLKELFFSFLQAVGVLWPAGPKMNAYPVLHWAPSIDNQWSP